MPAAWWTQVPQHKFFLTLMPKTIDKYRLIIIISLLHNSTNHVQRTGTEQLGNKIESENQQRN